MRSSVESTRIGLVCPELGPRVSNDSLVMTVVDQKIDNLLHVLDWDLAQETNTTNTFNTLFEFE